MRNPVSRLVLAGAIAGTLGLIASAPSLAATTEVVTEADVTRQAENTPPTDNWVLYTRAGTPPTSAIFESGPSSPPEGTGSLQLTTTAGSEKVFLYNYDHVGTPLADIDVVEYSTYRTAGSAQQVTALNVQIDYNGADPGGFATLVYEPVYNTGPGGVTNDVWQTWDADAGIWWSTQPINGQCAGATSACDKTWAEIQANNQNAIILAVGVNQGSGNPGLIANVDAFVFGETTYDFEFIRDTDGDGDGLGTACDDANGDGIDDTDPPTNKDQCKNGGYATFNNPSFRNQGQCVSYVNGRR